MKKSLSFGLFATLLFVSCTRSQELDVPKGGLALLAVTEGSAPSKTILEGGTHVYWEPGDAIRVFSGSNSGEFTTNLTSPSGTASFVGTLGEDAWTEGMDLWAAYPSREGMSLDNDMITMALPSEQVARAGSFGKDMNLSVAHSTTSTLQFYNVGGGVRFSLAEEGIQRVVLEGMDGEVLAGKIRVGFRDGFPAILNVTEGKTTISIVPSEGGTFAKDTWYYIVAIPGALEKGFKLHFHKAESLGSRVFDKPVTVKRGIFGTLTHADKGVTYAAVSNENISFQDNLVKSIVVKYFDTDDDGELSYREAAIVSSFMTDEPATRGDDGKVSIFAGTGITSFDEIVYFTGLTRIEDNAFSGCTELKAFIIPENIIAIGDNAFNGCTGLESITVLSATPPTIGTNAFANTSECPILVPKGTEVSYAAAWGEYENRIQPNEYPKPKAIDLGLPSGLKWASFNLGASYPEGYGDFFAWGEIEPYYISLDPLTWKEGKEAGYDWPSYKWSMGALYTMTKYCSYSYFGYNGFTDSKTVLEPEDDAAHVNLGGSWRMPTNVEWAELMENCTWTWTEQNGVNGRLVTGPNGNSIFLPAAGHWYDTGNNLVGSYGSYRSSSLLTNDPNRAWLIFFGSDDVSWNYIFRDRGCSVRPVYGESTLIPVERVSLEKTEQELVVGETTLLVATITPSDATVKSVVWSSNNYSVATVSSTGVVTGVAAGDATITVTTVDGGKTASCEVTVIENSSPSMTVPEAVDLGLSVKWASFNLGASKPEEYGDYFAWGETEPYYSSQDPLSWKEGKESGYSWFSYKWCMGSYKTMTKYCDYSENGYNGFTDTKTVLDLEDDAAHVNLGGSWRMPTAEECTELRKNCTWTWTTRNGVNGRLVTGPNGNSIFLPAAGYGFSTSISGVGSDGIFWSSSLYSNSDHPYEAYYMYFGSSNVSWLYNFRYLGFSVRSVNWDSSIIPVESVSLDKAQLELVLGKTATLGAVVLPEGATNKSVTWSSSNTSVATVSSNGTVTGVGVGTATITVTTVDGEKTATCTVTIEPYTVPTPEAIDLGLSVKWASFNLGASSPDDFGDYFAWGETEPKANYSWSSYKWCMGSSNTLTKYCNSSYGYNGFSDTKTVLDPEDDAAAINLGGPWRMPTDAEWTELRENCTLTRTTQNDVNGCLVTGPNGNSIFLPAAGYWSSSLITDTPYDARCVLMLGQNLNLSRRGECRYNGFSVRPVYGERVHPESVALNRSSLSLTIGVSEQLTATVFPTNAAEKSVTWSSSNTSVVTVSSNGTVAGVGIGTATITVTTVDGEKTATCTVTIEPYKVPTPEAIDLGLSVKWASFNLGASSPDDFGDYFAWGETEPKANYSWSSYKWCMGSQKTMTKYCSNSDYGYNGYTDTKTVLDPEDDAAAINLGGPWRMPTDAEWTELRESCTWTGTAQNDVNGCLVTGPNGNSIFLPAAGQRGVAGSGGDYWSSSFQPSYPIYADKVDFDSGYIRRNSDFRYKGSSVRPVCTE